MPYQMNTELPDRVKDHLPEEAQEIFRKAFNNAWEEYADPEKRRTKESREVVANKVAWSAVGKTYHKEGDHWIKNKKI